MVGWTPHEFSFVMGYSPVWWCNFCDRVWVGWTSLGGVEFSDDPLHLLWFGEDFEASLGKVTSVAAAHSSCCSINTAVVSLSNASGLGKTTTRSVRRLMSQLSRSSGFVDRI